MSKLRILIVDGDHMVLDGLRAVVRARKTWTVCATAANAEEGLVLLKRHNADVVVSAVHLPGMTGLELTRRAVIEAPGTKVLLRGLHSAAQVLDEARAAGAAGYIPKSAGCSAFLRALSTVAQGGTFFGESSSPAKHAVAVETKRSRALQVTPRERDVVRLIAEGKTSKEIGTILGISVKTVETHRSNLMRKLRLHSVSETVRYAIRHHYVVP